jgi:hypothetical protein
VTRTATTVPKGSRVVDSASVLTSSQIRSLGAVATCRYYAPFVNGRRSWKALTPAEIVELHSGGIGIIPNWESSASRPLGGISAGVTDGREFARQLAADGVPLEVLVIVSCDMNAVNTTSKVMGNRAAVESYFRAAFAELSRAGYTRQGIYGDTDTFRWLADLDLVGWLMVSKSFSDGTLYGTHIAQQYQSGWNNPRSVPLAGIPNSAYDPNAVLRDVDGVWLPHDEPVQPVQHPDVVTDQRPDAPPSASQEDDMPCIITCTDRNPFILDGGYATGVGPATMAAPKLTVQEVDAGTWDELVGISDAKKAADKARTSSTGPANPYIITLTGSAKPDTA